MKPFKAKYTELVLYLAGRVPFLFTRRLRYSGRHHLESMTSADSEFKSADKSIRFASLFSEHMVWKGVSLVAAINRSELRKIHKWMKSQKSSAGNYHESHDRSVESTDLVNSGWSNLGLISFGAKYFNSVGELDLLTTLPQGCLVTILKLPKGVIYLSLYISLEKSAIDRIFKVDVSDVKNYKVFQSLNPLSPRFSVIEYHSRRGISTQIIYNNARSVIAEARQAAAAVLEVCGVKKNIVDFATVIDFYRDGTNPYFTDEPEFLPSDDRENVIYEPSRGRFLCTEICNDQTEEYLENYISEDLGVDGVFIKSEDFSSSPEYGKYVDFMHSASDYYTYILYVSEVFIQFRKCMAAVDPVFSGYKKNARRDLEILIDVSLQLNVVEERLKALQEGVHWSDKKYWLFTHKRIEILMGKVAGLRADIDRRKELNNGELQLSNLVWVKRYSILVGFLVVLQIALSMLTVDWSEQGRDKNPVYINLFK